MNATILAVIAYVAWSMLLLLSLAAYRTYFNKAQKRNSLKFDANGSDVSEFGQRLTRAHANTYESVVFVVVPMLLAIATNSTAITNGLAVYIIIARVLQSCTHIASNSNAMITVRFVFFVTQFAISGYWLFQLITKFA